MHCEYIIKAIVYAVVSGPGHQLGVWAVRETLSSPL